LPAAAENVGQVFLAVPYSTWDADKFASLTVPLFRHVAAVSAV
jgi:hypothetical protein